MNASPKASPLSSRRKLSFTLIMLALPLVLFGVLELGLRAIGFGQDLPLFTAQDAPEGYLQPNPRVIQRYFPDPSLAPEVSPDTVFFKRKKEADVFRIFIQGGSTAAGFPYGRWGSLQGMLDQRFKRLYPDKKIEVINTAMSAVNSYTLLDFVDEIIAHEPDLVMIYAGHNEYLGILGAGSVFAAKGGRAATLTYLALKDLKIYQLLERIIFALTTPPELAPEQGRSLMARVASGQDIAIDSDIYHAGIAQFDGNLERILAQYLSHNIPVFLGTLASNEKDQPPFSTIGKIDWQAFERTLPEASASAVLDQQVAVEAGESFKRAKIQYFNAQYEAAQASFILAKDLDLLRFRAPSVFNDVIRKHAKKEGVFLVDSERFIREDTPYAIIGDEHMLEHLHPTVRGYFLLGEAFVNVLISEAVNVGLPPPKTTVSREKAWADVPVTEVAERYGRYKIDGLTSDFPFTSTPQPAPELTGSDFVSRAVARRANGTPWMQVQQSLVREYQAAKNFTEAAKIAGNLSDAMVMDPKIASFAGVLYRKIADFELSLFYFNRAVSLQPNNVEHMLNLAQTYYLTGQLDTSVEMLQSVLKIDPANSNAKKYLAKLRALNRP